MNEIEYGSGLDKIIVKRLLEYYPSHIQWDHISLTIDEIRERIHDPVIMEIEEYFSDYPITERVEGKYTKEWHIGRIKYFVNHPEKITPISIDNDCSNGYISGIPIITDGNHRFIAAVIRKDQIIDSYYSGLCDTLDYLIGLTDKPLITDEFEQILI